MTEVGEMEREICRGKIAKEIIKDMLEELEYIQKRLSTLQDDIDNCISKTTDDEIRKNLSYIYSELDSLRAELKNYCVGDCSLCSKNCEILCNVDCNQCVRFFKCLQEKKVSRMVFC
jgi:hypothetical protein